MLFSEKLNDIIKDNTILWGDIVNWFIIIPVLLIVIFTLYVSIASSVHKKEVAKIKNKSTPEWERQALIEKHKKYKQQAQAFTTKTKMRNENMLQVCKLENVYRDFKDDGLSQSGICLYDTKMSYEPMDTIGKNGAKFSIPYDKITDIQCDVSEKITASRILLTGLLAFAFKKKTHYTVITYKDDLTNSEQQLIFRVDNPLNKEAFINNFTIKRNQYLITKNSLSS